MELAKAVMRLCEKILSMARFIFQLNSFHSKIDNFGALARERMKNNSLFVQQTSIAGVWPLSVSLKDLSDRQALPGHQLLPASYQLSPTQKKMLFSQIILHKSDEKYAPRLYPPG